ncbi:MAG: hypothetical protein H0T42_07120 [Deltaproteobacteria bacterium]|nr:hypothetical protein [Deltaproteobacteria bacterium]
MRICPSLVLILSLAACEHASTATSTPTLPVEGATTPTPLPLEPVPALLPPAPTPAPEARMIAPPPRDVKSVATVDCSAPYRATRAGVKWQEGCEPVRVTKKPVAAQPAQRDAAAPQAAKP